MSFFEQKEFYLSTLSPIHIGTGEVYEPGNYVVDHGFLYSFEPSALAGKLSELQIKQLLSIVEKDNIGDNGLRDLQNFFKQNTSLIKDIADYQIPISESLEEFYAKRLGKVVHQEKNFRGGRNKKITNNLEIEKTIQNTINYEYYIPGSSIKGAIRTAILDKLNNKKQLNHREQRDAENFRKANDLNHSIQKKALNYNKVDEDPMKLIKVSDAHYIKEVDEYFPQSSIHFCINRKRKLIKTTSTVKDTGVPQIFECLAKNNYRKIDLDIRLFENQEILLKNIGVSSIENLSRLLNQFYLPIFKQEIAKLSLLNVLPIKWKEMADNLLNGGLSTLFDSGNAFLLKLGKHGGADTKTLNNIRTIKIQTGPKKPPKYLDEPTTYWLAADSDKAQTDLLPFGWVLIETKESDEFNDLKQFMSDQTVDLRDKMLIENNRLEENKKLKEQQEKRHIEEERLQQELNKKEQAKQDLLSNLSEEEQTIKKLELLLLDKQESNDKAAGGELSIMLNALLSDTSTLKWDQDLRNQLADVINQSFDFIGWGNKKKKPGRVSKVNQLREG